MESLTLAWWVWVVAGLVLLLGEMMTPGGFFLIFFGIGALIVGGLKWLGLSMSFLVEGLIFVVVSVGALAIFRKPLMEHFKKQLTPQPPVDSFVGEVAIAQEEIPVNGIGKAEMRGTSWNAQNAGPETIAKLARCRVERVEGLTLWVRAQ
jgi:inner membrane protein